MSNLNHKRNQIDESKELCITAKLLLLPLLPFATLWLSEELPLILNDLDLVGTGLLSPSTFFCKLLVAL